ncbi:MAG: zinc-ribbon domain-containing protein [Oscillospiraceae bacterium]|nr:zinc-ribbon domain-containing protein [Oscillospiraceae bacterium]
MQENTYCAECGAVLQEGAVFCSKCGTKVDPPEPKPETDPAPPLAPPPEFAPPPSPAETGSAPPPETVFCSVCGAMTSSDFAACPACGHVFAEDEITEAADQSGESENRISGAKKKRFIVAAAALAVVVIACAAFFIFRGGFFSNASPSVNGVVYVKDKEIRYAELKDMKPFDLTDRLLENTGGRDPGASDYRQLTSLIFFSDDGRYVFYPDRVDYVGESLSYYWRDLKAKGSEKDAVVKADGDIGGDCEPFLTKDGGKFFYLKSDGRFYVYDRKSGEKTKLSDDVSEFYVSAAGDYVIFDVFSDGEYSVYEMTLKGISGEKTKIDSNSVITGAFIDEKTLFYRKEGSLYIKEHGKDREKIASDVYRVMAVTPLKTAYYLKSEEITLKLSSFMNDDMRFADAELAAPLQPVYPKEPAYPNIADFEERTWVSSSYGSATNPDTGERGYWDYETDYEAYDEAWENYSEEYERWIEAYENLMTSFSEAMALYEGKEARDRLRELLDDDENALTFTLTGLYYYSPQTGGALLAEDVAVDYWYGHKYAVSREIPVIVYQKYLPSSASGDLTMSKIADEYGERFYAYDVIRDLKYKASTLRGVSDGVYVAAGDNESELECYKARGFTIGPGGDIYFLDSFNDEKGYGTLTKVTVSSGTVSSPVALDEDVMSYHPGNGGKSVYYFKNLKNGSGDLYLDGKLLADDVFMPSVYNFKDSDALLYLTDYSERTGRGFLRLLKGGSETKISDDVSRFSPLSEKHVAFLADYNRERERGDLILWASGKTAVMDTDVTELLTYPKMTWSGSWF